MDLRIVKTRKEIRSAFLALRRQEPLERIRVKRLCDLALINKTTFYKHYADIFALSEEIENETIRSILESFHDNGSLFSDPGGFCKGLYFAFKAHEDEVLTLFSGRMNLLVEKVVRQLLEHFPSLGGMPEREIALSFLLWGAAHVLMESRYEETVMLNTLARLASQVVTLLAPPPAL